MPLSISPAMLARYDSVGPRYTSYPTALDFHEGFTEKEYRQVLALADEVPEAALSVYTHIPFCLHRCFFCGCHTYATEKISVTGPYLQHLMTEIDRVAGLLPHRRHVAQYHLGGGTPTYFSPEELHTLVTHFTQHFHFLPNAELAIEVDPRVTSKDHIAMLASLGFNRISLGVQDFNHTVQEAIGRIQPKELTENLVNWARKERFSGVNFDLIYGLPYQTPDSFRETLEETIMLRPDRVAVYSFAYLPNQRSHQKQIPVLGIPNQNDKFALLALARDAFSKAGYQAIGMDHFALPTDELALAQRQGRLQRNFMGYTVMAGEDMIGFGTSAIGDVQGALVQDEKKLVQYYRLLDEGSLPIARGVQRTQDDQIRRDVINSLMCNFIVKRKNIEDRYGINFEFYFSDSLKQLQPFVEDGMAKVDDEGIHAIAHGQVFVRNLAMCFDAHLANKLDGNKPVFSRTI